MTPHTLPDIGQVSRPATTADWVTLKRTFHRFSDSTSAGHILRACVPELSAGSFEIDTCTILDARLKTYLKPASRIKSAFSACYHLALTESASGQSTQRLFYITVYLDGRSRDAFRLLTQGNGADPAYQQAVTHVPEQDLIIWRFPHDPALPHLRDLVDLPTVEQHLPLEGLRRIGMTGRPRILARQVVNYRPAIRCTHRYDLSDSTLDRTCRLFGKTFRNAEGRPLYERLQYFWDRSLTDSPAMAIAQPLGYTASVNTVWQLGVTGTSLLQTLDASNYRHYVEAIAKGLASLHTSDVAGLATHVPADHLIETRKKLTKLADAVPQLADTCEALADELEQTAPSTSSIPFRPMYWDFHIQQLLADNAQLTFCDLDELVIGDPIQDLANFVVDLHFRDMDQELVRLITAELCRQYRKLVEWDVPIARLAWHIRLQFVNKAYRQYLRFAPDFEETVRRILQSAKRGLPL
jgi:Phosphotransferase enzyme family